MRIDQYRLDTQHEIEISSTPPASECSWDFEDNVGTPFVLRSSDASNENNVECDDTPFLQLTSDDASLNI